MTKNLVSLNTIFSPPQSWVSLRIHIPTEEIFGYKWSVGMVRDFNSTEGVKLNDFDEVYNFVKSNDEVGYWLKHYHNLYSEQDGTYLENMFITLRRRYNKSFSKYVK
jgi:hypothetical protein